jgi:hypothetical protein
VITAINGVLLTPDDAAFIVGGFDEFFRLLAEHQSQPSPRLAHTVDRLRKTTRKSVDSNANDTPSRANATNAESSQADEAGGVHDPTYATVTTAEAARILRTGQSAVRGLAQRDPTKLGSVRIRGRWHHSLALVQRRAIHQGRAVARYP